MQVQQRFPVIPYTNLVVLIYQKIGFGTNYITCMCKGFCLLLYTWFTVVWCVVVKDDEPTRAVTDTAPIVKVIVEVRWTICKKLKNTIHLSLREQSSYNLSTAKCTKISRLLVHLSERH